LEIRQSSLNKGTVIFIPLEQHHTVLITLNEFEFALV